MMKNLYRIFVMVLLVVAAGCVYDYNPKDEDIQGLDSPLVVIDGDIIVGGITKVKVGLTQSLTEDEEVVPLGANVWVERENGEVLSGRVLEDEPNCFEVDTEDLSLLGRYRLGVSIPGRGEYLSAYKGVLVSPPIDSITYSIADDRTYARIEVTTHDDGTYTKGNGTDRFLYCKWNYSENWESDAVYPAELEYEPKSKNMVELSEEEHFARKYCFSEGISDGTYIANTEKLSEKLIYKSVINEIPNIDTRLMGLYSINVKQTALDREAYIYWENIRNNSAGTGGLFGPQPSELRGNVENVTYPDEMVIGYINVSTATEKRIFIDWGEEDLFTMECEWQVIPENDPITDKALWPQAWFEGLRPVTYYERETSKVYWALEKCTDCRVYSNSTRPDFWPR